MAEKTKTSPATARRSLLTLQSSVMSEATAAASFCARVLSLGTVFLNAMNLKLVADSFLQAVADKFHDSVSMTLFAVRFGFL